jgi:hypothetical protein
MTIYSETVPFTAPTMSVVDRRFDSKREVKEMTATTAFDRMIDSPVAHRARPHGLDRAVMLVSVSMLKWARRRTERAIVSPERHARLVSEAEALMRREHDSALRVARVR